MARKGKKAEEIEGKDTEGSKLEDQMNKEKRSETEESARNNYPSPGVLKKPSPNKSVNFEEDKRRFTTFVKVRLEIEGKKKKELV